MNRQKLRKRIILFSFFLFPVSYGYFSPYIIIDATINRVINGSFIVFSGLFIVSLFFGRATCGWFCPGAGCQEAISITRNKHVKKGNFVKWVIWVPWISSIVVLAIKGNGYGKIDFLYNTTYGSSIDDIYTLVAYLVVLFFLIVLPAFIFGKRSFCHHLCWMAPFMIVGKKISDLVRLPSLGLIVAKDKCINCKKCDEKCQMSLNVNDMVNKGGITSCECILCGECVDICPKDVIKYSFGQKLAKEQVN